MIEKHIDIPTADGRMDSFVVHPEEGGPFPAVVMLMDIWGLREELFDIARSVATVGYHVTLPNFWYRRGKVRFEYRDDNGRMRSLLALPKDAQDDLHANMSEVTDRMAMADIGSVLKFLGGEPVRQGPKGTIGYCLGGRLVACGGSGISRSVPRVRVHARHAYGKRQAGLAASLRRQHARRNLLRLCREGRSRAARHHRDAWKSCSPAAISVKYRAIVHPGTVHGYALPDRDIFDKPAANRDWENIFAMFKRQLG